MGMSTGTGKSSTESDASGLNYKETELTLGMPGGSRVGSEPERRRGFSETVELTLGGSGIDKHGDDRSSDSSGGEISGAGKPPAVKAQVVRCPQVRTFRWKAQKSCKYVKVAVDGAPYLWKVDLDTYGGYQHLLTALEEMFSCFTIRNYPNERRLVDPVNGTEYAPTYENKDGDWMLVGDVPWNLLTVGILSHKAPTVPRKRWGNRHSKQVYAISSLNGRMFVASCKCLRVMKSSKLVVSTSCSLMHTVVDLVNVTNLDNEIKSWLAFPKLFHVDGPARSSNPMPKRSMPSATTTSARASPLEPDHKTLGTTKCDRQP